MKLRIRPIVIDRAAIETRLGAPVGTIEYFPDGTIEIDIPTLSSPPINALTALKTTIGADVEQLP